MGGTLDALFADGSHSFIAREVLSSRFGQSACPGVLLSSLCILSAYSHRQEGHVVILHGALREEVRFGDYAIDERSGREIA